ncbi:MlaD family protein [Cupriavidus basilensis]
MKRHDKIAETFVLSFKESVRGLTIGAPVDFRGIVVGEVTRAYYTRFDREKKEFSIPVEGAPFIRSASRRATSRESRARGQDQRTTLTRLPFGWLSMASAAS